MHDVDAHVGNPDHPDAHDGDGQCCSNGHTGVLARPCLWHTWCLVLACGVLGNGYVSRDLRCCDAGAIGAVCGQRAQVTTSTSTTQTTTTDTTTTVTTLQPWEQSEVNPFGQDLRGAPVAATSSAA